MKYEYLYNSDNILTHNSEAIRGDDYRIYPNTPLDFTYKEGQERQFFTLKLDNPFSIISGGGESVEHYNAKMKIAHEKKYYDTVFKQEILFDEVIAEQWHEIKKRPDLSCYNNGKLIACIEIFNSNNKKAEDINKLKELDCLIIEIDINNGNRCEHIALQKVLEDNKRKYTDFEREISELETEYNRVAKESNPEFFELKRRIDFFKNSITNQRTARLDKINIWLQKRLRGKLGTITETGSLDQIEREVKRFENSIEKLDYATGKIENRLAELRTEIKSTETSFNEIGSKSKIEWFRNTWMTYEPQNKISEIKYWLL